MSKCREAFEDLYDKQELVRSIANPEFYADLEVTRAWRYWQAAWNARGKVDAEICESDEVECNYEGDPAQACAAKRIRKAIEKEKAE